jgi:hypothetical protein
LSAGGDSCDPIDRIFYLFNEAPDPKDDSFPPNLRTLLGPPKTRSDLRILFRSERDNLPGLAHECNSGASGSDVDRKQEILCHERADESLRESPGSWPIQYDEARLQAKELEGRRLAQDDPR